MLPDLPDELTVAVSDDVSIRLMRHNDSAEFFLMIDRTRSDLRQWLSWVDDVTCVEDIYKRYDQCLKSKSEGRSLRFFILHQESIIGMLAAKRIDWEAKLAELSYSLAPNYRGGGIATQSCNALINYLSDELGIDFYEIRTAVGNRPSERVAEKLGLRFVAIRERAEKLKGHWIDHKIYTNKTDAEQVAAPNR